jgi:phosphate transport system ATP-binding protein
VLLDGRSIFAPDTDPDELRARVGILFQQPVVFPGSVYDNVVFGLRRSGRARRRELPERARAALAEAALWREVEDRLGSPAGRLSTGQQQRLCLARALALEPEVLLMDEPTSALDPRSAEAIEELIGRLKHRHAIVLVTHNLGQARRVADRVACLCVKDGAGELLECAPSVDLFGRPRCREVVEYLCSPLAEAGLAEGSALPVVSPAPEEAAWSP